VDAASNRGIDEVRELREKIKFAPAAGKFRVYIIDEVHMLTNEAFNALLKTLEEPPRHAVLVLATTEPHKVPLTILSRCQRFDFRRLVPADIISRLREVAAGAGLTVEDEALRLIARAAEGSLRDALSILDQGAAFGGMQVTAGDVHDILGTVRGDALRRMAEYLAGGEAGPALRLVSELAEEGKELRLFARELAAYLRVLLLEKISSGAASVETWSETEQIKAVAAKFSEGRLVRAVEIMAGAEQGMKFSNLPGIVLEVSLVKACRPGTPDNFAEFAARLSAVEERLNRIEGGAAPKVAAQTSRQQAAPEAETPGTPGTPGTPETPETRSDQLRRATQAGPAAQAQQQPEEEPVPKKAGTGEAVPAISREQLKKTWSRLMKILHQERMSLYHNYQKAVPLTVKGRCLVVGFREGEVLAKNMAERTENKKYLEGLLAKFWEGNWQVAFKFCRSGTGFPERQPETKQPVAEVKRRFEGEEVDLEDTEDSLF
jgi:DNA polymerase-3 subunit gamma/tau